MSRHEHTPQDAFDALESAARHRQAWLAAEEPDADAYRHLTHAVHALDRLVSIAEVLRAPLAEAQFARETDQADTLLGVWDEAVGDRDYGFDAEVRGKTATLMSQLDTEFGDVRLYRLSEPLNGYLYVTVSAVDHGRPETYIFGADADGNRVSSELPGSTPGVLDHDAALGSAGYSVKGGAR